MSPGWHYTAIERVLDLLIEGKRAGAATALAAAAPRIYADMPSTDVRAALAFLAVGVSEHGITDAPTYRSMHALYELSTGTVDVE
jgi:hypothetical protein